MDTLDKVLLLAFTAGGVVVAALTHANSLGLIVGGLAGIGLLGVLLAVGSYVDEKLGDHYGKKGRF